MSKRMLIDATHAEETRVVVMDGNRLEDYDVESAAKKQLKGNIYLARVIRVEPSLQAAFVEYGGNRHGFLAFSEIHPDYYQIPVADREQLLALQAEEETLLQNAEDEDEEAEAPAASAEDTEAGEEGEDSAPSEQADAPEYVSGETDTGEEALIQKRIARFLRNYRIQEVIRRRQVMLVQVVKEERGNKGAALTTYVSLAGRYCVLMPNALRGGGVSRKITSVPDRKRLRDIISGLNLPRGMAMIVRTAGAQRPGPEITRDCEYLLHLWDDIRDHTLRSMAPALIYEEASLVKRAIRDVYTRDVSEIVVDGESGWKAARDFMRMLMPQHAEKVRLWNKENQPLFTHYQVEGHLDAMFSPVVPLRSGGYLVINQTEALVAIDVNSGKATSQRNIEETAFRTNQEAADEVARQLRLRDLAGLIVIDFIDMESRRHNTMIERRLKDALRNDRARIQIGSISHFGLLEMSRQRLRPSVAEAAFVPCPHCNGTGVTRSVESSALHVLRSVEEEGARRRSSAITVHVAADIAFYILNNKRDWLGQIEQRHQMEVLFSPDATLPVPEIRIERRQSARHPVAVHAPQLAPVENVVVDEPAEEDSLPTTQAAQPKVQAQQPQRNESEATVQGEAGTQGEDEPRRRRRRRRRRRSGAGENAQAGNQSETMQGADADTEEEADEGQGIAPGHETAPPRTTAEVTNGAAANLVPGRRRTRHTRVRRDENEQQSSAQTITIEEGAAPQPRRPVWNGPTPANPFGGAPDIFELLENSVQQHITTPRQSHPAHRAETPVQSVTPVLEEALPPAEAEAPAPVAEAAEAKPARRPRRRSTAKTSTDETVQASEADTSEAKPTRRRTTRKSTAKAEVEAVVEAAPADEGTEAQVPKAPRRRARKSAAATQAQEAETVTQTKAEAPAAETDEAKAEPLVQPIMIENSPPAARRRTGWWKR